MLITEWNMEEALEVAKEEAKEESREETTLQIAENMLADGIEPARVARITKLPEEQIMALKQAS